MSLIESLLKQGAEQFELSQAQAQADGVDHTISSISVGQDGQDEQQASEPLTIVEQLLQQGAQQVTDERVTDEPTAEQEPTADEVAEPDDEAAQPDEQLDEQVADEQAQVDTQVDEQATDEMNAQLTEIIDKLEREREEIARERADFQRQLHDLQAQLIEANQRADEAERDRKQVHLSNALIGRDDVKDARLVARLINVDELDSDDLAHSITQKVNEVLRNYPTLAVDNAKQYITRDVDGLKVRKEVKPIGKPMGQSDRDNGANKATELEKLRKRAIRSGSEVDRVAYAKAKRALGLVKEVK